jgi:hypothetical protein
MDRQPSPLPIQQQPLKYDWTTMAYTDGSQKKLTLQGQEDKEITVIGSGVYLQAREEQQNNTLGSGPPKRDITQPIGLSSSPS